jgi:hypothetical protein
MQKAVLVAFGLTEDDIKANSAGRLAGIQRRKLIRRIANLIGTILFLFILLCRLLNFWVVPMTVTGLTCVIVYLFGMGILERTIQLVRTGTDLAQECVGQVEGRIYLKPRFARPAEMQIGNQKFRITTAQLLALRNELPYTAYFSPRSKVLLAAAPIQEDEVEPSELTSSELLEDVEKPKRGQVALGDDGELIALETPRSKQQGS